MHLKTTFFNEKEANGLFQGPPFYNVPIEKPHIKHLKYIDLLNELSFYNELAAEKTSRAFKGYGRGYKTEIVDSKDPSIQLTASNSSVKDLFKDLLDKIKCFKYQITEKVLLRKHKENGDIKFDPALFNSTTKALLIN